MDAARAITTPSMALSATAMLDLLESALHARSSEWIFLRELRVGTGFHQHAAQRLDAFALNCLPHTGMRRVCYEVKVSRADFLGELRQPLKRRIGMRFSNEFYFVTSPGLISTAELPIDCGLIEIGAPDVASEIRFHTTVPAPWRDTPAPSWNFAAAMLRHQARVYQERPAPPPKQQKLELIDNVCG